MKTNTSVLCKHVHGKFVVVVVVVVALSSVIIVSKKDDLKIIMKMNVVRRHILLFTLGNRQKKCSFPLSLNIALSSFSSVLIVNIEERKIDDNNCVFQRYKYRRREGERERRRRKTEPQK